MPDSTQLKARPTTYKGVQMRSRLEARYAGWADRSSIPWDYEPTCFAYEGGQYLPDFRLDVDVLGRKRTVYVEVKPTINFTRSDVERWTSAIAATEPDAVLVIEIGTDNAPWLIYLDNPLTWFRCSWTRQRPGRVNLVPAISTDWREVA